MDAGSPTSALSSLVSRVELIVSLLDFCDVHGCLMGLERQVTSFLAAVHNPLESQRCVLVIFFPLPPAEPTHGACVVALELGMRSSSGVRKPESRTWKYDLEE